jgi:hypothetical protein
MEAFEEKVELHEAIKALPDDVTLEVLLHLHCSRLHLECLLLQRDPLHLRIHVATIPRASPSTAALGLICAHHLRLDLLQRLTLKVIYDPPI